MNAKQAMFIRKKLIPFILREQGRGFAMSCLLERGMEVGVRRSFDMVLRKIPVCGTVCCIAGSAVVVARPQFKGINEIAQARKILGLTYEQGQALFMGWDGTEERNWPDKFIVDFRKAKTPLGKARVACRLLELVTKTRGKCLDPVEEEVA